MLDIFFLAEADIKSSAMISFMNISGYSIVFSGPYLTRGKSRLIAIVRDGSFREITVPSNSMNEVIGLKLGNSIIVGVYRPFKIYDSETERSNFVRLIMGLDSIPKVATDKILVVGDFNIDMLKPDSRFRNELTDWVDVSGLEFMKHEVTRVRKVGETLQTSCLDLIITNIAGVKCHKDFSSSSDHCMLRITVGRDGMGVLKRQVVVNSWKKFDELKANAELSSILSKKPSIFGSDSPEEIDYQIRASVRDVYNMFVKSSSLVFREFDVYSPKIQNLKNKKKRMRKIWTRYQTKERWELFIKASKELQTEVKKVKRHYLRSKMNKGMKDFGKEVNLLMGGGIQGINEMVTNTGVTRDKQVISDMFVDFFVNKVEQLSNDYRPSGWREDLIVGRGVSFDENNVKIALERLSGKKSSGPDHLLGLLLKKLGVTLVPYLVRLFNKIMEGGAMPRTWKVAKIIPVHKKGLKTIVSNYRPVSNLNSIAKVFELCILQKLEEYDLDMLLGTFQHGFRPSHSTDTAVSTLVTKLSDRLATKNKVICYSADLTAAFDLLQKEILVDILHRKGIQIEVIKVIFEYLSDRQGFVQVDDCISCVRNVKLGCVQGSILGPILFNVYTSELESVVSPWELVSYADDTYVVIHGNEIEEVKANFKETIIRHERYLNSLGMICNKSKTEAVAFGVAENVELSTGDDTITTKSNMKVLGIWVDKDLKWTEQVDKTINKCRSLGFCLRYLKKSLSKNEMRTIFLSHFVSKLAYGSSIWFNAINFKSKQRLRSLYYKQIRTIIGDFEFKLNRYELAKRLGVPNFEQIFFRRQSMFLFSILTTTLPTVLFSKLISNSLYHERTGNVSFFRESLARTYRSNVVGMANQTVQKWSFEWFNLSKEAFIVKIAEI